MKLLLPLQSFLFVLLCLLKISADAQGLCNNGGGGFDVNITEGCAPFTVRLSNTVSNAISVSYNGAYDGRITNLVLQDVSSITYRLRGTFTLLQQVVTSSGIGYACKTITVFESRPLTAAYSSCGGGKITLSLAEDQVIGGYDEARIEWGDGETSTWKKGSSYIFEHNYTNTSTSPTVKVTGVHVGKSCAQGATASIPISFQQAQLNDISIKSVEMLGGGILRLNYLGATAIPTEIKYSTDGNTFGTAGKRSSGGLQPFDISNVNVNQSYKVKLSSQDLCQGLTDSKVITSMTLAGKSEDGKNVLTWNKYPTDADFVSYDLLRDGTVIKSFNSIDEITYTDEDVACGSYSEYQVIAKIKDVTSTSAPVGVKTEVSSARPILQASVSVAGDNRVFIKASVPGAGPNSTYDLSIEKAESGTPTFRKIITLYNQNEYLDPDVRTSETSYCYRFNYQNSCGQKLPVTQPICTILLKKNLTTLNWSPESPLLEGIDNYEVSQIASSGATNIPNQLKTSYTVQLNSQSDLEYNFQVRANSASGDFESLSNIINYRRSAGVFVPDAFSPNGDGYNDVLEAKSTQLQSFAFSVLNRWGEVVFHSDDIAKGWDGTINGANAPVGSYVYKMTFVDDINQTVEKSGTFMLLR
ncbi:T9SS type B sorting domain-containing protein [Dyadobacter crusticola]|uniref:T9SS type B sorting domain-containing protein n=1 Tax=Dyadobacter crusticola TaxID=292407 RepID=UPI0009FD3512|nr:gliding motility-associated C-terminal domain-containing protein [Dyadobacter crusticola]